MAQSILKNKFKLTKTIKMMKISQLMIPHYSLVPEEKINEYANMLLYIHNYITGRDLNIETLKKLDNKNY